jgi:hypothetical protein
MKTRTDYGVEELTLLSKEELLQIDGGSEVSEWFIYGVSYAKAFIGTAINRIGDAIGTSISNTNKSQVDASEGIWQY